MNKEFKSTVIDELAEQLSSNSVFYLADFSGLNAEETSNLRRACFKGNVSMRVVKNTMLQKAMEKIEGKDYSEVYDHLAGPTSIMFSEVGNGPAKIIEEFRKKNKRTEKPALKAAYVEEVFYFGDDQLSTLVNIKSKDELLGELIALLQSPAKNLVSSLQSGKNTIAGLVKALGDK